MFFSNPFKNNLLAPIEFFLATAILVQLEKEAILIV